MSHILVIDANQEAINAFAKQLIKSGVECDIAMSTQEARQKLAEHSYKLIILDIFLGEESGMEFLKELRANDQYDQKMQIVIFTNTNDRPLNKEAMALGANDYIAKVDFTSKLFIKYIKDYLFSISEREKTDERNRNGGPIPKHKKIFMLEEDMTFVDLYGTRIQLEGYEFDFAYTDKMFYDKVDAAEGLVADVLLFDVMTYAFDRTQFLRDIQSNEKTKHLKIFIFAADVDDPEIDQICTSGLHCFRKSYVAPGELVQELNSFLDN